MYRDVIPIPEIDGNFILVAPNGYNIIEQRDDVAVVETEFVFSSVDLMQYAGLKDKNGTEIYEGDIVMYEVDASSPERGLYITQYIEEVYFNEKRIRFELDDDCGGEVLYDIQNLYGVEVIGNIYENPELLTNTICQNT